MKKTILLFLVLAAAGYSFLVARPGLYYDKSMEYKNFTLRARGALPEKAEGVFDAVLEKIPASDLFSADEKFDLYLPASRREFAFFTPFQNGDYSRVNPLSGAIFLASADFAADRARLAAGDAAYRRLSVELTAAAAREMIRSKNEPLTYLSMKDWKVRGYAERLSGGTGEFTPADLCNGKDSDHSFLDYKYGQVVDFALKEENISITDLLGKSFSYESLEKRLKAMNCGK